MLLLKLLDRPGKYEFWVLQIIVENKVLLRNENLYKCNGFILLYFSYVFISTPKEFRQNNDFTEIDDFNETL